MLAGIGDNSCSRATGAVIIRAVITGAVIIGILIL